MAPSATFFFISNHFKYRLLGRLGAGKVVVNGRISFQLLIDFLMAVLFGQFSNLTAFDPALEPSIQQGAIGRHYDDIISPCQSFECNRSVFLFFILFFGPVVYFYHARPHPTDRPLKGRSVQDKRGEINRVQKVVPGGYCLSPCARTKHTQAGGYRRAQGRPDIFIRVGLCLGVSAVSP